MAFTLIYVYHRFLEKRISNDPNYCEMLQVYLKNQEDLSITGLPSNGLQTVDLIQTQGPNLVIIDAVMPKLEGLVVLEHVNPSSERIPCADAATLKPLTLIYQVGMNAEVKAGELGIMSKVS